jgi:SAM-dependent methyltransferase
VKSMLETHLSLEQTDLLAATLRAQTRASGSVEAPRVAGILSERRCRDVLDIGTGEGSFLLEVARRVPETRFLGIDHNAFAVRQAAARLRRSPLRNVRFQASFFDSAFDRTRRDAVFTRYTLQHCSRPGEFLRAAFQRLERGGTFVAIESVESGMDCHVPDPVWQAYRAALLTVHEKLGSDADIGKALGGLLRRTGFRRVRVEFVITSPATVGFERFRSVVLSSAALAHTLFPGLFGRRLLTRMEAWLRNRSGIERRDPYIVTALACATRP